MRIIKTRQAFDGDEKDSGDEKGSERGSETQPSRPPSLRAPSLAKAPPPEAKCLRRDGSPMGRSSARPNRSSSHAKELYNSDDEQHTKLDERVVGFSVDERSLRVRADCEQFHLHLSLHRLLSFVARCPQPCGSLLVGP